MMSDYQKPAVKKYMVVLLLLLLRGDHSSSGQVTVENYTRTTRQQEVDAVPG